MRAERSPLVERFECESGVIETEINKKLGMNPLITKALGFVATVSVLSLVFMAGRQTGSWQDQFTPIVGYPQNVNKIKESHLSEAPPSNVAGAAALADLINAYRGAKNSKLLFVPAGTLNANNKKNPLMVAAQARSLDWAKGWKQSTAGWVKPEDLDKKLGKDMKSVMKANTIGFTTPQYKEYAYYGKYCATALFNLIKAPGMGIKLDGLDNPNWSDLAIGVSKYENDGVSGSNNLGNAYYIIIFATSTGWKPK